MTIPLVDCPDRTLTLWWPKDNYCPELVERDRDAGGRWRTRRVRIAPNQLLIATLVVEDEERRRRDARDLSLALEANRAKRQGSA